VRKGLDKPAGREEGSGINLQKVRKDPDEPAEGEEGSQ
jgi:hypothetical protein